MIIYATLASFYYLLTKQNSNLAPPIFTIAPLLDEIGLMSPFQGVVELSFMKFTDAANLVQNAF